MPRKKTVDIIGDLIRSSVVACDIGNVTVHVMPMQITDTIEAEKLSDADVQTNMAIVARVVANCLCDENGNRLHNGQGDMTQRDRDAERLMSIGPERLGRLFSACCQTTGLTEQGGDDDAKNLPNPQP